MTTGITPASVRSDLTHLDGLRGTLALLVLTDHTARYTGLDGAMSREPTLSAVLALEGFAVPVFIVLSGFTLMISLARRDVLTIRGGAVGHVRRRAKRLLPPYFAALALSIALIAAVPLLGSAHGTHWDRKIPLTVEAVISHVFLLHNLTPDLIGTINGPMWSIAVEWQIALAMPLMLLLWRRTNAGVLVGLMAVVAVASVATGVLAWSAPSFPLLFVLGMLGAHWTQGAPEALERRRGRAVQWVLQRHRPVMVVAVLALVAVLTASVIRDVPFASTIVGVLAALILTVDQEHARTRTSKPIMVRFLRLSPLRAVGNAAYSICLVHLPLLALGNLLLLPVALPTGLRFLLMMVTVAPLALACCGLFHIAVERRFMNTHQRAVVNASASRARGSARITTSLRRPGRRIAATDDQPPIG